MKINLERLKHALTAQTFKNDIVSNNLANINTTGYKRDVLFMDLIDKIDTNNDNKNVLSSVFIETKLKIKYALLLFWMHHHPEVFAEQATIQTASFLVFYYCLSFEMPHL